MPFITEWLIPDKILYSRSYGVLTAEDLHQQVKAMYPFAEDARTPFHYMVDGTYIESRNFTLKDIRSLFSDKNRDPNLRLIVAVDPSAIARFFASIVMYVSGRDGRQVATVEEGLRFLTLVDSSLPPLEDLLSTWQAFNARIQTQIGKAEQ
ncbi:MAG: hypothetical protein RLP44_03745 [Aggregatilineales bacterium]